MRQPFAILLIVIHLFNTGGYRFVFDAMEEQASVQLVRQLDNEEYTDDQLIEMKVPLPMPYQTNWSSFERYNGEIEIGGVHYNYVKRKVWNDTLILLCIPNHGKMSLNSAKEQFFSLVNDLEGSEQGGSAPKGNMIKSITTDFQPTEEIPFLYATVSFDIVHGVPHSSGIPSVCLDLPAKPPRAIG